MKIALIGAGLSGLATGWFLLNSSKNQIHITFFDPSGIGGGASGMAAGLMHPYSGASAKLNRYGLEGYQTTLNLLHLVSEKIGESVIIGEGLWRIALTERQKNEYRLSSEKHEDIEWFEAEELKQKIPSLSFHPGIFIRNSVTINCPNYLEGLWRACEEKGAILKKQLVNSLDELENFDKIIIAAGASVNTLLQYGKLPITGVKGQILEVAWPKSLEPLPHALNSYAYLLMDKEKNRCNIGATYERNYESISPNLCEAEKDIMPKAIALIPLLEGASILGCKAGIRASTPDHLPLIQQIGVKYWVITGMGSKGLLYHALYAKKLSEMIINS